MGTTAGSERGATPPAAVWPGASRMGDGALCWQAARGHTHWSAGLAVEHGGGGSDTGRLSEQVAVHCAPGAGRGGWAGSPGGQGQCAVSWSFLAQGAHGCRVGEQACVGMARAMGACM